jgi:putative hydrolase of the HAD superfamily
MPAEQLFFRAVLFDLDDTLNDRSRSWMTFVAMIADPVEGYLLECVPADVHRKIIDADRGGYRPKDELFAELQKELPWKSPKTAEQIETLWRQQFPRCMAIRASVKDVLNDLRHRGVRTGIVTNGRADGQRAKIEHMGLSNLVDTIVISGLLGFKKPDRRIYEAALNALAVKPEETLFVGDNPESDVIGPLQLGMKTAWLANGRDWLHADGVPDFTIAEIAELGCVLLNADGRRA